MGCRVRFVLPLEQNLPLGQAHHTVLIKFLGEGDFYFKPN